MRGLDPGTLTKSGCSDVIQLDHDPTTSRCMSKRCAISRIKYSEYHPLCQSRARGCMVAV